MLFGQPLTLHADCRERAFNLMKICRRQLDIDCSYIFAQVIFSTCTGNRNNPWLPRQKPRECDLSRCCFLLFCKLLEQINHRSICCDGIRREPRELSSQVRFWVQLRLCIDFPGQITLSKRSPGDEADP